MYSLDIPDISTVFGLWVLMTTPDNSVPSASPQTSRLPHQPQHGSVGCLTQTVKWKSRYKSGSAIQNQQSGYNSIFNTNVYVVQTVSKIGLHIIWLFWFLILGHPDSTPVEIFIQNLIWTHLQCRQILYMVIISILCRLLLNLQNWSSMHHPVSRSATLSVQQVYH